jgi:hypothetical protein
MVNILSVDVEQYFHLTEIEALIDRSKGARGCPPAWAIKSCATWISWKKEMSRPLFCLGMGRGEQLSHSAVSGQCSLFLYSCFDWGLPRKVDLSEFARGVCCDLD